MRINTYLINLDGSDERLASATTQLNAQQIPFERVPAFDGRGRAVETLPNYSPASAFDYMGRPLRGGEVGCYLSHLDCAQRLLDSPADYAFVLEDDMALQPDTLPHLIKMLEWLDQQPFQWDVINVGANRQKYFSPLLDIEGYVLGKGHYFPMTTTALLWNRQGAESFVRHHATIKMPVDNALREWQSTVDRGLTIAPALVTTTGSASDIDEGAHKRNIEGRSSLYGLKKQRRMWRNKFRAWAHQRAWRKSQGQ